MQWRVQPLEPNVANAASVARQVGKRFEAIEMVDREVGDRFRRREPEIDGNAAPPVGLKLQAAPAQHASAGWTKVDFKRRLGAVGAPVGRARSEDADALVFIVIRPEHAVAAA